MNVKEEIQRAIKHGIYVGTRTPKEEMKYLNELLVFLNKKKNFSILEEEKRSIKVSSDYEDLADIYIHVGTLKIVPLTSEGYFKVFMDVLEFISEKYKKEVLKLPPIDPDDDESTEDDGELWL
tara:strand:+ start:1257 stop:1625 length:369 start_codon:yes stop_codon:yes gene_type:complete